jgi:hydrophobic/amphiphilic exporter-1 (mainly G- bacteria), HAE1 family
VRHKLPVEMREPILRGSTRRRSRSCSWRCRRRARATPRSRAYAEDELADRFRGIDGVAVVNVNGALRRELSVLLRSQKLREYNVSVTEVVNALRMQNTTAPVGRVRGALDEQSIRLVGRIESPREFEDIVVRRRGSEVVRLGQVATSRTASPSHELLAAQRQSQRRPFITRSRDASTVAVANEIRALVAEINKSCPGHQARDHAGRRRGRETASTT